MQINTSEIALKTENESFKVRQAAESVKFWVDHPVDKPTPVSTQKSDFKENAKNNTSNSGDPSFDFKIKILEMILKEIYNREFDAIYSDSTKSKQNLSEQAKQNINDPQWHIKYDRREISVDYQLAKFKSEGIINTKDRKQISFSLDLQYQFTDGKLTLPPTDKTSIKKDAIVVNFDGNSELLDFKTFEFDLNNNEILQRIPYLKSVKGLLVIDSNSSIKDRIGIGEMGTVSANGFKEMEKLGSNKNMWLEELDDTFSKLKTTGMQSNGFDKLTQHRQNGVETNYLGRAATNVYNKSREIQFSSDKLPDVTFPDNQIDVKTIHQLDYLL